MAGQPPWAIGAVVAPPCVKRQHVPCCYSVLSRRFVQPGSLAASAAQVVGPFSAGVEALLSCLPLQARRLCFFLLLFCLLFQAKSLHWHLLSLQSAWQLTTSHRTPQPVTDHQVRKCGIPNRLTTSTPVDEVTGSCLESTPMGWNFWCHGLHSAVLLESESWQGAPSAAWDPGQTQGRQTFLASCALSQTQPAACHWGPNSKCGRFFA